ncbi:hypothetical protein ACQF6C_27240, partial [Klebsiella pneumoniae]|jgi:hypothetical protein
MSEQIPEHLRAFCDWLRHECHYEHVRLLPDGRIACVYALLFTDAIIVMEAGSTGRYDDRWCYDKGAAERALAEWDGTGEPHGWHRHPDTDRRRRSHQRADRHSPTPVRTGKPLSNRLTETPSFDCRSCGACCSYSDTWPAFTDTDDDESHSSRPHRPGQWTDALRRRSLLSPYRPSWDQRFLLNLCQPAGRLS